MPLCFSPAVVAVRFGACVWTVTVSGGDIEESDKSASSGIDPISARKHNACLSEERPQIPQMKEVETKREDVNLTPAALLEGHYRCHIPSTLARELSPAWEWLQSAHHACLAAASFGLPTMKGTQARHRTHARYDCLC